MAKRWTEKKKATVLDTIFGATPPTRDEVEHLRHQINCHRLYVEAENQGDDDDNSAIELMLARLDD